ncbi:hypothetical protein QYE76_063400 [Lolium multiflorum]|uniref:Phytocyanin domain-containing protein n=1 Tax=Lolium multiflorum TaxID=4521 RepID=A0AAD8S5L8_LOLMU|nr:hypothetical protein QYE76_063400 [Lolium multiflorum]
MAIPCLPTALLAGFILLVAPPPWPAVSATDHVIGDSIWSIPTSNDHYRLWASNRTFYAGDNLVFRFDTGMYNVMQVGRGEYDACTAEDPYQIFDTSPAVYHIEFPDVRYFISSIGNYCSLGVKIWLPSEKRP